jgi:hypothetical protein
MIYTSLDLQWLRYGIGINHRGATVKKFIYGGDTETYEGEPMTFQFFSTSPARSELLWIDPQQATRTLLRWCKTLNVKATNVIYVHNLEFDLVSFFWDQKHRLVEAGDGEFDFTFDGWHIAGVYGQPTYARMTNADRTVILVDSFSYYRATLAKAADVFCPDLPKLKRPEGLGSKRFGKRDAVFAEYAMRDAEVACHIGIALESLHGEFDLTQTVSVADMAARIFRHRFLEHTIPQPQRSVIEAALCAYHGGKNNVTGKPGWYLNVKSLDISSAYPHAMASFPSFSYPGLYKKYRSSGRVRSVPDLGVYLIDGTVGACAWPSLFAHDFSPLSGDVAQTWVSGYELNEALRTGEVKLSSVSGTYYDAEKDRRAPPLLAFVDDFYQRKEAEKDKPRRQMYKFILNAISGKFIQTRKRKKITYVDVETGKVTDTSELVAGGMFHPFIAQAITGHTRSRIHQLEHRYNALHTATDGIFTQAKNVKQEGKGLGAVVCEAQGDLLMFRNKLYILYGPEGETLSQGFKGKRIIKYALHGFQGSVGDLEKLVVSHRRKYKAHRVNRLRDSLKRGLTPNQFQMREYILKVGQLPVYG